MRKSVWLVGVVGLLVCFGGVVEAATLTIAGPTLIHHTSGWANSGMQFTAQADVCLTSFMYENQGLAGNVYLKDTVGNALQTYAAPAGEPMHVASVDWELDAGTTYRLISANDGRWVSYTAYPTANAHLSVAGVVNPSGGLEPYYWMHFTDLTTTDECRDEYIPEPATLAMLLAGVCGVFGLRARRRS